MHFIPALRSATVKNLCRIRDAWQIHKDITAEQAAKMLRELSEIHYLENRLKKNSQPFFEN